MAESLCKLQVCSVKGSSSRVQEGIFLRPEMKKLFLLFRTNQKSSNQLEPTFLHERHMEAFGKDLKKGSRRQCSCRLEP